MKPSKRPKLGLDTLVRISAVLTLAALALMVWSLFDPTVGPVMIAMSLGQLLGTLSFVAFLIVVVVDVRRNWRRRTGRTVPPPAPEP